MGAVLGEAVASCRTPEANPCMLGGLTSVQEPWL